MNILAAWMVFTAVFTFNNAPNEQRSIEFFARDHVACAEASNYLYRNAALYGIMITYTECINLEIT